MYDLQAPRFNGHKMKLLLQDYVHSGSGHVLARVPFCIPNVSCRVKRPMQRALTGWHLPLAARRRYRCHLGWLQCV